MPLGKSSEGFKAKSFVIFGGAIGNVEEGNGKERNKLSSSHHCMSAFLNEVAVNQGACFVALNKQELDNEKF